MVGFLAHFGKLTSLQVAQGNKVIEEPERPIVRHPDLISKAREGADKPRDQKRLKPLGEAEDAVTTPFFERPVVREFGSQLQQAVVPSLAISQELTIERETIGVCSETQDCFDSLPETLTKSFKRTEVLQPRGVKGMAEIVEEVDDRTQAPEHPKVAVAVGEGQSGFYALKWVLTNLVSPGEVVYLLHVQAPLRYIPTPMGNSLPVEKISEDIVSKFKLQRFMETEKLLNQYRQMCNKRQVKPEVCYSEGDVVQQVLVDQISNLSIEKLVVGTSSHSRLKKAFKGPGISSHVAKHAPDFCTVMVVYKGKLASVKDGTKSVTAFSSSHTSVSAISDSSGSSGEIHEDWMPLQCAQTADQSSNMTLPRQQVIDDDVNITAQTRLFHSASADFSHTPAGWFSPENIGFSGPSRETMFESALRTPLFQNSFSGPSGGRNFESTHQALLHQPEAIRSIDEYPGSVHSNESFESPVFRDSPIPYIEETVFDSNGQVHGGFSGSASFSADVSIDGNVMISEGSNQNSESLEVLYYTDPDTVSPRDLERRGSDFSNPCPEALLQTSSPLKTVSSESTSAVTVYEDLLEDNAQMLKYQLKEAKLSAGVETEIEIQANHFKQAEEIVNSAMKMLRQRDDAVRDAHMAKQQALKQARRCEEALTALEEAKEKVKTALKDQEAFRQRASAEARNHGATLAALEESRKMVEIYKREAEFFKQQVAADSKRYEQTVSNLEELKKALEVEVRLRKEAEEKVMQEAVAKQEVLAALRKTQKYSEYSFEALQAATNNFQEQLKLGEGGYGAVYKGKVHHTTVAIKVLKQDGLQGREEFQREVEVLSQIHHPHMVMLLGACPKRASIVYEYMANGSLEDRLNCKDNTPPLPWYVRFRICSEVATALLFLHSRPEPIVHRDLKPGNILLDHNFVSKISDVGLARLVPNNMTFNVTMYKETVPVGTFAYIDPDYQRTGVVSRHSDVYALGIVMLQLLTGKPAVGVTNFVEEAVDNNRLSEILDKSAGEWPLTEAMELACLSLQCAEPKRKHRPDLETQVLPALESIRVLADVAATNGPYLTGSSFPSKEPIIPSFFMCPISQEIMEEPYIAADGFTYEHLVMKAWLEGHNTSPMTNLRLNHKNLIPNHTLRSAIKEWQDKGRLPLPK